MNLRPYQQQAIEAITAAERRGVRCQLAVLPTGTGKTVVFASLLKQRAATGRALVLAHRDELLQQAKAKILAVWPQARVGVVRGSLNETNADVIVASVQTLARERRLKRLAADFSTVIVDEAHHISADSYGRILEHCAPANPLLVGVTATPYRGDGKPICADDEHATGTEWFAERVFEMDISDAIADGYLCDIEGRLIHLKGADFSQVHTRRGDLDTKELEALMTAANWQEHLFKAWADHASNRRTVVFVPPKRAMAWALEEHFKQQGVRVAAVTGDQDAPTRHAIYRRFADGELSVLVNCEVLTEGWDEPAVDCVLMARPTKSKTVYVQAVGRGLRLHPGKENCLVLDVCGVTQRHDLMSLAALAGVKSQKDGETFTEAKKRAEQEEQERAEREEQERQRIEAEHEARRIELIRKREEREKRDEWFQKALEPVSEFKWQALLDGGERLALIVNREEHVFRLSQDAAGFWRVGLIVRHGGGATLDEWHSTPTLTADGARRAAETKARELIEAAKPAWMRQPATEAQIAAIRRFRHPVKDGMTKGEASEILDRIIKRKREAAA